MSMITVWLYIWVGKTSVSANEECILCCLSVSQREEKERDYVCNCQA